MRIELNVFNLLIISCEFRCEFLRVHQKPCRNAGLFLFSAKLSDEQILGQLKKMLHRKNQ